MQLVAHWRLWWRRWSTWLAGIFAAIVGTVMSNPGLLVGLVSNFPAQWRGFAAGATAVLVFIVPVLVTHIRQGPLKEKSDAVRK